MTSQQVADIMDVILLLILLGGGVLVIGIALDLLSRDAQALLNLLRKR